jgi:hypothetical protein
MHIYDLLGLRGGSPRLQTPGWTALFGLGFGAVAASAVVFAVEAAADERWWPVVGWLLSATVCGVILAFVVGQWRRLRAS